MLKSKKGSIMDTFAIMPILFTTAIMVVVGYLVIVAAQDTGIFDSDANAASAIQTTVNTTANFDNLFFFVIMGLSAFMVISAYFVFNHPAFFIIGIIILSIAITVAAPLSNAYETFYKTGAVESSAAPFVKVRFLMDNFPIYILFMGLITVTVMGVSYVKEYQ